VHTTRTAWVAVLATLAALWGCADDPAATASSAAAPPHAVAPDALCEHGVLAAACPKCNPRLEPVYRAKGDWCEEHGLPLSFCPVHHPERGGRPAGVAAARPAAPSADVPPDGTKVRLRSKVVLEGTGIATARAAPATDGARLTLPARLVYDATRTADLNARSPGVVRKLVVDLGAAVKRGDPLATIESAAVGADRARLGAAQKGVAVAEERVARLTALEREGAASRRELLDAERDAAQARAEAAAIASELSVAGASAGSGATYTLTSPIEGVVARRPDAIGALVGPDDVLFQIVDARSLWAEIDVPEAELGGVPVGSSVVVSVPSLPGEAFAARVTTVAPAVDPHTRTAVARAAIDNAAGRLRANMFGEAAVLGAAPPAAVTVPSEAVQSVGGTRMVFVRAEELVFSVRHVEVAQRRGARTVIASGLRAGEEVATTGAFLLKTETLKDSIGAGCCEVD
jgi:cobalt-zinc-cadmium efflux system membrane fusion protein